MCQHGYYANLQGECAKIQIKDCLETVRGQPTVCDVCDHGIQAVNGMCNENNKCGIQDCNYCDANRQCKFCENNKTEFTI